MNYRFISKITSETSTKIDSAKGIIKSLKDNVDDRKKLDELISKLPKASEELSKEVSKPVASPMPEPKKTKDNTDEKNQKGSMKFDFDLEALTKAVEEEAAATGGGFGAPSSNTWEE